MFPAHAGMNRLNLPRALPSGVFPAHAGMNPRVSLPRGAPRAVFPAHAGMNRRHGALSGCQPCVPRTRGDEPSASVPPAPIVGVPRIRGDEPSPPLSTLGCHVFPAHAGMNRRPQRIERQLGTRSPRMRG